VAAAGTAAGGGQPRCRALPGHQRAHGECCLPTAGAGLSCAQGRGALCVAACAREWASARRQPLPVGLGGVRARAGLTQRTHHAAACRCVRNRPVCSPLAMQCPTTEVPVSGGDLAAGFASNVTYVLTGDVDIASAIPLGANTVTCVVGSGGSRAIRLTSAYGNINGAFTAAGGAQLGLANVAVNGQGLYGRAVYLDGGALHADSVSFVACKCGAFCRGGAVSAVSSLLKLATVRTAPHAGVTGLTRHCPLAARAALQACVWCACCAHTQVTFADNSAPFDISGGGAVYLSGSTLDVTKRALGWNAALAARLCQLSSDSSSCRAQRCVPRHGSVCACCRCARPQAVFNNNAGVNGGAISADFCQVDLRAVSSGAFTRLSPPPPCTEAWLAPTHCGMGGTHALCVLRCARAQACVCPPPPPPPVAVAARAGNLHGQQRRREWRSCQCQRRQPGRVVGGLCDDAAGRLPDAAGAQRGPALRTHPCVTACIAAAAAVTRMACRRSSPATAPSKVAHVCVCARTVDGGGSGRRASASATATAAVTATLADTSFNTNSATAAGGAIYVRGTVSAEVTITSKVGCVVMLVRSARVGCTHASG
jgi:predicted outer membrane repeat protein